MECGRGIGRELTREKIELIRGELMERDIVPDCIVVGGPSNSMIRHGPCNRRGFGPEKRIVLREERRGEEE